MHGADGLGIVERHDGGGPVGKPDQMGGGEAAELIGALAALDPLGPQVQAGSPHGPQIPFQALVTDARVLGPAAILYIDVSREESWRRNVARYQEKLRHSILAHMVPRETYDYFYDVNDWPELTRGRPSGRLDVAGVSVPFVTMNNEPESTDPAVLEERYSTALGVLWALTGGPR